MYPNFIEDRKTLGYKLLKDSSCGIKLVLISHSTVLVIRNFPSKVSANTKRIIVVVSLAVAINFSTVRPAEAIGLSSSPRQIVRVHQPSYKSRPEIKIAPTINPRLDKIRMMATNEMIPLIYINGHYGYINEKVFKKLRAGNLTSNLTVIVVGVVVYIMFQLSGVDAFTIFNEVAKRNAPQPSPSQLFEAAPSSGSIPTRAQEFNDMSLRFNEPKISYNFVMSDQEADTKVNEMYPGVLEISSDRHISDTKAANKIYHASQLGVNPEDYGMTKYEVERIRQIGIYKYAREGHRLPPIELIKDYQMAMKNICTNGELLEGTYSSKAEQKIHKALFNYNRETIEVVGFYKETGELITSTKYKQSTFARFLITKNLGKLK